MRYPSLARPPRMLLGLSLLVAASLPPVAAALPPGRATTPVPADVGQAKEPTHLRVQMTAPSIAEHGFHQQEEAFVQDLYARLMRYDLAGRKMAQAEAGAKLEPAEVLTVALRNFRTALASAAEELPARPVGPHLQTDRVTVCHQDDPCHAYYRVTWSGGTVKRSGPQGLHEGPVIRVTTYDVTLRVGGRRSDYTAQVRYHDVGDRVSLDPEVVDPVVPGLQEVADDDAPLAVGGWARYVNSPRYKALVKRISALHRAGKRAISDTSPIGFLPGDDISAEEERLVMMTASVPCSLEPTTLSLSSDNPELYPDGVGVPSATTVYVMTDPPTSGLSVTLTLSVAEANSGGHSDGGHAGNRPLGGLANSGVGVTGSTGGFYLAYVAPAFGERVNITATAGSLSANLTLPIRVPGLQQLGSGAYYTLVGETAQHPVGTNHWGTPAANAALQSIAVEYHQDFTGAEALHYNDQSLPLGGKFEINGSWSLTTPHDEHRTGRNVDVSVNGVPIGRWAALVGIFTAHGATVLDETGDNHWHLTF